MNLGAHESIAPIGSDAADARHNLWPNAVARGSS
jgi:hypothetical protein